MQLGRFLKHINIKINDYGFHFIIFAFNLTSNWFKTNSV